MQDKTIFFYVHKYFLTFFQGPDTFYADQRIENYPVRSKNSKSKTVNFRYIAYSCRLVEIAFLF